MRHLFSILSFVLFFCGVCHSQTPQKTYYRSSDLSITEIIIWDEYRNDAESDYHPTCITPLGNTADLAAYINLQFIFPKACSEMFYEGRNFYTVTLDDSYRFLHTEEVKPLCVEYPVKPQLEAILSSLPRINTKRKEFTIEIRTDLVKGLIFPYDILPNW